MLVKHANRPILFRPHLLSRTLGESAVTMTDPVPEQPASDTKVNDLAMLLSILSSVFLIVRK